MLEKFTLNLSLAIFKFAADTGKMLPRYSCLCGTTSDAVDAVILLRRIKIGNPEGFQIIEIQKGLTQPS